MSDIKKQSFVKGAAILAVSTALVKIMGAIYKIPLQNIIGDEGMGHFGVAYQIYNVLLALSTAGLPIALSKMVSSANAMGRPAQVKRIFNVALMAFFILGLISTLIMLLFPEALAVAIEESDSKSAPSIRMLGPAIICVCIMSAYRGYTQGLSDMIPTSVSQIIETASKLVFGLTAAWWLVRAGESMSIGAAGAIFGVSMGTLLALVYIIIYTNRMKRRNKAPTGKPDIPDSRSRILKQLAMIGIPIVIGSCVLSLVGMIDTKMIFSRLQNSVGLDYDQTNILYGVYFSTQTLYNLPSAFIVPLTVSAIPAISAYTVNKQHRDAAVIAGASIKLTNLIAIPAAVGMSVLSYPIMNVLYEESHPEGVAILAYLGIASYFVCLYMVTLGILQAYGHERKSLVTLIIGGICKIIVNYYLIGSPYVGIRGAAISNIVCYLIISILNLALIYRYVPQRPQLIKLFIKPLLASAIMGVCAYSTYGLFEKLLPGIGIDTAARFGMALAMGLAIVISVIVYLLLVVALRVITKEELELVPKGEKIAKLLRIK